MLFVNLKALLVVLVIAVLVFTFSKRVMLAFTSEADFIRRRRVWFVLTVIAFLSPNFWIFTFFAAPMLYFAGRRDSNPVALYLLMMQLVPPFDDEIPVAGIGALFPMNIFRILALVILLPTALKIWRSKDETRMRGITLTDVLFLAFAATQVALFIPPDLPNHIILPDSFTNLLRRIFLFSMDAGLLYYVISRACSKREILADAMAAFLLSGALIAGVGIFEMARHWLLYVSISANWGGMTESPYLFRSGVLRAMASTGHALDLGYLVALAFGFWLYLGSRVKSRGTHLAVLALLGLGLLSAYSRGPWVGAAVIYVVFLAFGPRARSQLLKSAALVAVVGALLLASPIGDRIIRVLPFMGGTVDVGSITYRQQLFDRLWDIVRAHPYFGDQLAYTHLEDLRQGQGIIDLVNTYAAMAAFHGLTALAAFLGLILLAAFGALRASKRLPSSEADLAAMGRSLIACIAGTLVMLATASFILSYWYMYFVLAALTAAYVHVARAPNRAGASARVGQLSVAP